MRDPNRRDFLRSTGCAALGLGAARGLPFRTPRRATATAVVHLHLGGGLSHIDSFDPKPEAPIEVRGPFGTVACAGHGERIADPLPKIAAIADKITIVRSVTHSEADHDRGTHSVLTGFQPSPAIVYPSLGAVVAHELPARNDLPPYVCVPGTASAFEGTGYLSAAFAPFAIGDNPARSGFRVRDLAAGRGIDDARRERRKQLLHELDAGGGDLGGDVLVANEAFYRQAWALIESPAARDAFDLAKESDAMKNRYGRTTSGMGCLLARRLVQGGARYVTVNLGGFDHHAQIGRDLAPRLREVDQTFAALVADLDATGLLATTVVLLTTEFGRTPKLNPDAGRDHWQRVFSVVLAGGGIARGVVHGASNATGAEPERDPVHPADLAATVFAALGIDPAKKLMAPGDRPIDLVRDGRVLREVLA